MKKSRYSTEEVELREVSEAEKELKEWLSTLKYEVVELEIPEFGRGNKQMNSFKLKNVLKGTNVAIEFNSTLYHSQDHLDKNYHYRKSRAAEKQGIRLIHVLEAYWEMPNKRAIYETIIRNALGAPIKKARGRDCEIRELTAAEARPFFDENHMGGYVPSKYAYGLFYEGELVQAELFAKARFNRSVEWESTRGCSKLGWMIYGGYEKVLKRFKEDHDPKSIVSYVDYNIFIGTLHEHAGFVFQNYTGPDHWYLSAENDLKRYWIVRGNKPEDLEWAEKRDAGIQYHYWFAGSKVYIWEKEPEEKSAE